jgi:hypothetical protein
MDLTIKSSLSETVETNSNYFLSQGGKPIVRPQTAVTFDALGQLPTTTYDFSGDFAYFNYLGPGAENLADTDGYQGGGRFRFESLGKTKSDKANFTTSWRTSDVVSAQLADTGIATRGGQFTTTTVGGGFIRQLGLRDTISWNATSSFYEFSSGTSPYTNLYNVATWDHRVSPIANFITLADYSWIWRQDLAQSETKFARLMAGTKISLTKRLEVTGNVGIGLINGSQQNSTVPVSNGSSVPYPIISGIGSAQRMLWDVTLAYRLQRTTTLSANAAQTISPDVLGNLSERQILGFGLQHEVNSLSTLQFTSQYVHYTASGSQSLTNSGYDYYLASASYIRRLTKELRGQITYTYRRRESDGQSADSHSLMVVVSKDFTLLPHIH